MEPSPTKQDTSAADVLRGFAILLVVAYHIFGPVFGWHLPWIGNLRDFASPPSPHFLTLYPLSLGWAGVSLFFVLSGFCIHLSYLRKQSNLKISAFLWRRFWRIYPAYIIAVLAFSAYRGIDVFTRQGQFQLVTHATFTHNFFSTTFFGINASFWSIAVEMQLYLLFPLLVYSRHRIGIELSLTLITIVSLIYRLGIVYLFGVPEHLITASLASPIATWGDWTLGALVAERFYEGRQTFYRPAVWLCILAPVFVGTTLVKPLTILSFSFAAVVSAVILDSMLKASWNSGAIWRAVSFTGTISYSLYLWHQPALFPAVNRISAIVGYSLAWGCVLCGLFVWACLSYLLIEKMGVVIGEHIWKRYRMQLVRKLRWGE